MLDDSRTPSAPSVSPPLLADVDAEITIRPVTSLAECQACVALQDEIWGAGYGDAVPASMLKVVSQFGGVLAGAFTADGELVGFVFGLAALIDGEIVHWSHVLGVRESARNAGVGRMLKEYQRAELARRGISRMYWTFDPLVAKNAHLNVNVLSARVLEYVQNMYGTTGSPLHRGLATDRIIVVCAITADRSPTAPVTSRSSGRCPVLTPEPQPGDIPFAVDGVDRPPALWLEIPADIQMVMANTPSAAATWQVATRSHFEWALRNDYTVTGLHRDPVTSRAFYVLELPPRVATA